MQPTDFSFCHKCAQGRPCLSLPQALSAEVQKHRGPESPLGEGDPRKKMWLRGGSSMHRLWWCSPRFACRKAPRSMRPPAGYSLGAATQRGRGRGERQKRLPGEQGRGRVAWALEGHIHRRCHSAAQRGVPRSENFEG